MTPHRWYMHIHSERGEVEEPCATSWCIVPFIAGFSVAHADPTLVYRVGSCTGTLSLCGPVSAPSLRVPAPAFWLKLFPSRCPSRGERVPASPAKHGSRYPCLAGTCMCMHMERCQRLPPLGGEGNTLTTRSSAAHGPGDQADQADGRIRVEVRAR